MSGKRAVQIGAVLWAVIGAVVAFASLPDVSGDARLMVGLASAVLPLCAVAAAVLLDRDQFRVAGFLLLVSAATPTYFAYALNIPALVAGLALLAAPSIVRGHPQLS